MEELKFSLRRNTWIRARLVLALSYIAQYLVLNTPGKLDEQMYTNTIHIKLLEDRLARDSFPKSI